jgi:hypothetical protein
LGISVPIYSYADDTSGEWLRAYNNRFEFIASVASRKLDEIYPLTPKDFREKVARSNLSVSVKDGMDRRCFRGLTTGYLRVREKEIVLCKEDLDAAVDMLLAFQLVMSSTFVEKAKVSHLNIRFPPFGAYKEVKDKWFVLAAFYVRANSETKNSRFLDNYFGPFPCYGWQAAAYVIEGRTLSNCSRTDSNLKVESETADWAMSIFLRQANMFAEYVGTKPVADETKLEQSKVPMLRLRDGILHSLIYFVVAHELGHLLSNSVSVGGPLFDLKEEIAADIFAINSAKNDVAYAEFVPWLAVSLHWLWQEAAKSSGEPAVEFNRVQSIGRVAYCGDNPIATEQLLTSNFSPLISAVRSEMCKEVSRR